jgi:hypothetical protein
VLIGVARTSRLRGNDAEVEAAHEAPVNDA